jgi:hypothetical protein
MRYILASALRDLKWTVKNWTGQSVFEPRLEHGRSRTQWSRNFAKLTFRLVGSCDNGNERLGSLPRQEKFLTTWTTIRPTCNRAPSGRKSFMLPYKFLTPCACVCVRVRYARVNSCQPSPSVVDLMATDLVFLRVLRLFLPPMLLSRI